MPHTSRRSASTRPLRASSRHPDPRGRRPADGAVVGDGESARRASHAGRPGHRRLARRRRRPASSRRSSTQEAVAHAHDRIAFRPGGRVTVPFKPRVGRPLGGRRRRAAGAPGRPSDRAGDARAIEPDPSTGGPTRAPGRGAGRPPSTPADVRSTARPVRSAHAAGAGRSGRAAARGLRLPAVLGADRQLDLRSTGRSSRPSPTSASGRPANGNLQKKNSDGSTTVGWSGWTSSRLTGVINAAHASGARGSS